MGKIGDIFWEAEVKFDDAHLTTTAKKAGAKAGAATGKEMGGSLKANFKKAFSGEELGKGLVQGLGLAGVLGAANLAATGLSTVKDIIGDSINAASDLNETMTKSANVFGENADEISKWGDDAAMALGLSKNAAVGAAAGFGDLFNKLGLGPAAAKDMSTGLVQLSADLASFNNLETADVLEKIRAGLAGESEPLRSLGVFLNEAKVAAKAAELGLVGLNGELTEGAKVQARYALIMEETASAHGDFAETSDGLANSQRQIEAALADASAELGQVFLPIAAEFAKTLKNDVVPALRDLIQLGKDAGPVFDALGFVVRQATTGGFGAAQDAMEDFGSATKNVRKDVTGDAAAMERAVSLRGEEMQQESVEIGEAFVEEIGGGAKEAERDVRTAFQRMVDNLTTKRGELLTAAQNAADAIYQPQILKGRLAATEREISEQKQIATSKKSTKEQVADAKLRMAELRTERIELIAELVSYGQVSSDEVEGFIDGLQSQLATASAEERAHINALIKKLREMQRVLRETDAVLENFGGSGGSKITHRHSGGPVLSNEPYIVGERGPELFVPSQTGTIIPAGDFSVEGGGNTTLNIPVTVAAVPEARNPFDVARQMGRVAQTGLLPHINRMRRAGT